MIPSSLALLLTGFLDCVTTAISLSRGNAEVNPVYTLLSGNLLAFLAFKIAITVLFVYLNQRNNPRNLSPLPWIIAGIWLFASLNNLVISL